MYDFEFVKPASLADAAVAMGRDGAQALSGGQTLLPTMKQRLAQPAVLVSLTGIADLKGVSGRAGASVTVGAATTHAMVARGAAAFYPALAKLAGGIGDPAVRNRGTIGGSLANNDPAACYPAAVLASGATVVTNRRSITADDYFEGLFSTALGNGEIITSVSFPIPEVAGYMKFNQPASRFALTGVFVAKYAGGVRVAVTGASQEGVFRWAEAEAALSRNFSLDAVKGLVADSGNLINDLHGSAAYRAALIGVLTTRAVASAN